MTTTTAEVKTIIAGVTFESLATRLAAIKAAESITKKELGLLSREVLSFLVETSDVRIINTLLGRGDDGKLTLTVANRKAAGLFFQAFVPFTVDADSDVVQFAKKKAKVWDAGIEKIEKFLADESNDIWAWIDANVKIEQKEIDYAGKITKDIEKAMKDEVNGLSGAEVMAAVLAGGVSVSDLMTVIESIMREEPKAA